MAGSEVSSGCAGGSLLVVVRGFAWGNVSKVIGTGVAASVASGMGMGPEYEVSFIVGSLMVGGCRLVLWCLSRLLWRTVREFHCFDCLLPGH